MAEIVLREPICPIEQWISSTYYIGKVANSLRPYWKQKIIEYFKGTKREFLFTGSQRLGKCVIGSTRVASSLGYLPIKEIFNYTEDGCIPYSGSVKVLGQDKTYKTVSHLYKESNSKVLTLETVSRSKISGTPEHPVWSWVKGELGLHSLQEIVDNKGLIAWSLTPIEYSSQNYTLEYYYSLGKWVGDGYVARNKHRTPTYLFMSVSYSSVEHFKKSLGLTTKIQFVPGRNGNLPQYQIICTSILKKHFSSDSNTYNKRIPVELFSSSIAARAAFLQGLLDTDGFIQNGQYCLDVASESLRDDVCSLFESLGIRTSRSFKLSSCKGKKFSTYRLRTLSTSPDQFKPFTCLPFAQKRLGTLAKHSFQDSDIPLSAEESAFFQSIHKISCPHSDTWTNSRNKFLGRVQKSSSISRETYLGLFDWGLPCPNSLKQKFENYYFEEVVNVVESVDTVYDITVPDGHTFYAQGLLNHNTYAVCVILMRYIYEIYCVVDFPTLFGLDSTTLPKIIFFSFSKAKADSTGIDRLIRMIDSAPWFNEPGKKRRPVQSFIEFPWVQVFSGVNESHATGEDLLGAVLDEANVRHVAKNNQFNEAQALFTEIVARSYTTFSWHGKWRGFSGLISTTGKQSSFIDTKLKDALEKGDRFVVQGAIYDFAPEKFATEKFKLCIGSGEVRPFILDEQPVDLPDEVMNATGLTVEQYIAANPELIKEIPVDLKRFYQEDINYALANLSGITRVETSNFFKKQRDLDSIFELGDKPVSYPLMPNIGIYDDFDVVSYFDENLIMEHYAGQLCYAHNDISKSNDRTGIAIVYYDESVHRIRTLWMSYLYYDRAVPDNEIDQEKIILIYKHLLQLGIKFGKVTADQYASVYVLQQLKLLLGRDKVDRLSVDLDSTQYVNTLNLARKHALSSYYEPLFKVQLQELIFNRYENKVDHPHNTDPVGKGRDVEGHFYDGPWYGKDLPDGYVGAVYLCSINESIHYEDLVKNVPVSTDDGDFYSGLDALEGENDFYSDIEDYVISDEEDESFIGGLLGSGLRCVVTRS